MPLKLVQNTVGEGDIIIEMYVREHKKEATHSTGEDPEIDKKYQSENMDEER